MKYCKLYFLIVFVSTSICSYSLEVLFGYCPFKDQSGKPYAEFYFKIPSWELSPIRDNSGGLKVQASFTLYVFKDSQTIYADKFVLNSKSESDTTSFNYYLLHSLRLGIAPGPYKIRIDFFDPNNNKQMGSQFFNIEHPAFEKKISSSGIELLSAVKKDSNQADAFHKNGLFLEPMVLEFFPDKDSFINFYTELYISDTSGLNNIILTRIRILDQNKIELKGFEYYKKYKPTPTIPFIGLMDIKNLPSGNYFLEVCLLNKNLDVLHKNDIFFQRLNFGIADSGLLIVLDSLSNRTFASYRFDTCSNSWLSFQVLMLAPLVEQSMAAELQTLAKSSDINKMKEFIRLFWLKTNQSHPLDTWLSYEAKVLQAESNFATRIEHGFQTDRGRIFLKYGPPNNLINNKEAGSIDYEIWHYYKLDGLQSNIRFVFYNPTMLYNGMVLLHSNSRGEKSDPNWKQKIYKDYNGPGMDNIDDVDYNKHSGSQLERSITF